MIETDGLYHFLILIKIRILAVSTGHFIQCKLDVPDLLRAVSACNFYDAAYAVFTPVGGVRQPGVHRHSPNTDPRQQGFKHRSTLHIMIYIRLLYISLI